MKNQANIIIPKETNEVPVTSPKEMEVYSLFDRELKIIILNKP